MDDLIKFMENQWIYAEGDVAISGLNEDALDNFDEVFSISLPEQDQKVSQDEVIGELETDQGPVNIYAPADGTIIEINDSILEKPQLIVEDCYGDGWLFKIECEDPEQIEELRHQDEEDEADDENDDEDDDYGNQEEEYED